jgi:hypothetical protein
MEKEKNLGFFFTWILPIALKSTFYSVCPYKTRFPFLFLEKFFFPCFAFLHVVSEKKQIFPYHYIF